MGIALEKQEERQKGGSSELSKKIVLYTAKEPSGE